MEAALFILLIAVINFINLSTAQSLRRTKEIAIHKLWLQQARNDFAPAAGNRTPRSFSRLSLQSCWSHPFWLSSVPISQMGVTFHPLHPSTLLFIGILILITTLLAYLYPAMVTAVGTPKISLRKALMVFQFTISLAFIIGAITMNAQIRFMVTSNPGFNANAVVTLTNFSHPAGDMRLLKEKAAQLPASPGYHPSGP